MGRSRKIIVLKVDDISIRISGINDADAALRKLGLHYAKKKLCGVNGILKAFTYDKTGHRLPIEVTFFNSAYKRRNNYG